MRVSFVRWRTLGVATAMRSEFAPDVPTFEEQGIALEGGSMRGFVAPAGLPPEVEAKFIEAFDKLAADKDFAAAMAATSNPVELKVGSDFKALNAETLDLAKTVWETSPWN